ncbi:unnamed protein product [Vicia faba]|uniref:Uncharacterized protein n=1 Tax=Vicia faba TaxID=3906 RepID=A0AAV1AWD2_VICFA|nr:unnamed protein product [Vicia faba]
MHYVVLAQGLFGSRDDLEDRCVNLQKDVDRLTDNEKSYVDKVSALEKSLVTEVSNTKTLTKSCEDLQDFESKLSKKLDVAKKSYADLQQSLERSHMDAFNVGDMAFDGAKDQMICLYPTLDISSVDFFKSIVDGKLMDVEDVDGSPVIDGLDGNDASLAEVTK